MHHQIKWPLLHQFWKNLDFFLSYSYRLLVFLKNLLIVSQALRHTLHIWWNLKNLRISRFQREPCELLCWAKFRDFLVRLRILWKRWRYFGGVLRELCVRRNQSLLETRRWSQNFQDDRVLYLLLQIVLLLRGFEIELYHFFILNHFPSSFNVSSSQPQGNVEVNQHSSTLNNPLSFHIFR